MQFNNIYEMVVILGAGAVAIAIVLLAVIPQMPVWAAFALVVYIAGRNLVALADDPSWTRAVMAAVLVAVAVRVWWWNYRRDVSTGSVVVLGTAWLAPLFAALLLDPYVPRWVTMVLAAMSAAAGIPIMKKLIDIANEAIRERRLREKSRSSDEDRRQQGP